MTTATLAFLIGFLVWPTIFVTVWAMKKFFGD